MKRGIRASGMRRAGALVESTLADLRLEKPVLEQKIIASWPGVVGPQIAAATTPERIRESTLFVACKSSMWANELSLHKTEILKGLNAAAGKNVLADIRFSGRGFRKTEENCKQTEREETISDVAPTGDDLAAAEEVAAVCCSEELAARVRQAMLAGKRLQRLRAKEGDGDG